jgi:hypothetical protein
MSYISLLFTSGVQSLANACTASRKVEPDLFTSMGAAENAWDDPEGRGDGYYLPTGIASLEHWLDLNA